MSKLGIVARGTLAAIGTTVFVLVGIEYLYRNLGPAFSQVSGVYGEWDQVTALFGAATLALATATIVVTFVAVFFAILAFYGWKSIRERVEEEVKSAMKREREYDQAQFRFSQAIILGLVCQYLTRIQAAKTGRDSRRFFLEPAIEWMEKALEAGLGSERLESHARNGLAYLLAMRGHSEDAVRAMDLVYQAEKGEPHGKRPLALLLTKGTVIGTFYQHLPDVSLAEMEKLLAAIKGAPVTRPGERGEFREIEAELVMAELGAAIAERRSHGEGPPKRQEGRRRWLGFLSRPAPR